VRAIRKHGSVRGARFPYCHLVFGERRVYSTDWQDGQEKRVGKGGEGKRVKRDFTF
jgi:hypothetical protein